MRLGWAAGQSPGAAQWVQRSAAAGLTPHVQAVGRMRAGSCCRRRLRLVWKLVYIAWRCVAEKRPPFFR